ncbi:TadE/TadG family type IV pilus assembly protein [Paenibacillus sp. FJAT-26967]|uniref:TadE/TadG family type IV pilus assembly protein n=1 Tax=Paenibacillus sp. FJAT-26967 TaxID=1729690 RepID=UPI0008393AB0|nr:hypothetical protein [Paenibacillus sp. FJAT-26967]
MIASYSRRARFDVFIREDRGNFTLEASLIFPFILISTLILIVFGLYVYNQVVIHQTAGISSERAAFVWDNSSKDPLTGAFVPGRHDGLYWRLTQDAALGIFGYGGADSTIEVPGGSGASGPAGKLSRTASLLPGGVKGNMNYTNRIWSRIISADLEESFKIQSFLPGGIIREKVDGQGASHVVDPVELIRTVDLTRTYVPALKNRISAARAKEVLVEPGAVQIPDQGVLSSEAQARAYIKKLVSGTEKPITTAEGDVRNVDALDASGTAHQAYYTFTDKGLREQMKKDISLKNTGNEVKGIVWHFFKNKSASKPSKALLQELAANGIAVIFHE